jgi:hypothetical protein
METQMKPLSFVVLMAILGTPPAALAQTAKEVVSRGVTLVTGDNKLETSFTADGKFVLSAVVDEGTWRIDGDKLCSKSSRTLIETCTAYPPGKKSGDSFELQTPSGRVTVQIK